MTPPTAGRGGKVILDLCAGTGAWSQPYLEAGYFVHRFDIQAQRDVRLLQRPLTPVHGILAAPPCTVFSRAGARWKRSDDEMRVGLSVVDACLRIVFACKPVWWALENPIGKLSLYLGAPIYKCDPSDFGDPWTKRTWLWGDFKPPMRTLVCAEREVDVTTTKRHGTRLRSQTPPGFARAFFEANP